MYSLDDIKTESRDVSEIVKFLDKFGICVVKNFLDGDQLSRLTGEHEAVYSIKDPGIAKVHGHPTNEDGMVARCKTSQLSDKFSTTKDIFLSDFMREVTEAYFMTDKTLINDEVFFTHEKHSETPILPWHFDRQQSLKFYINLLDVDESNGAFGFDIGSHREGHFRANYYILSGVKIGEIPNDIPEDELHNPVTIAARAGDLVIFDPDGFHCGGSVSPEKERKIVRGHSHPLPNRGYEAKRFDVDWWLQSPFNLAKYLSSRGSRILPEGRLSNSVRTR